MRLDWEAWAPECVLSDSGDHRRGTDTILEAGTSRMQKIIIKCQLVRSRERISLVHLKIKHQTTDLFRRLGRRSR